MTQNQESKWIAVAEKMPEDLEDVLGVHEEYGGINIVYWTEERKCFYDSSGRTDYRVIITHWQPLPEPPAPPKTK